MHFHSLKIGARLLEGRTLFCRLVSFKGFDSRMLATSSAYLSNNAVLSFKNKEVKKYIENLSSDDAFMREGSKLSKIVHHVLEKEKDIKDLRKLMEESPDLKEDAKADLEAVENTLTDLETQFFDSLVDSEVMDHCDAILELSTGVGGQEAMLFCEELYGMYKNFARFHQWDVEILSEDKTEIGGIRHASLEISGAGVFKLLKFESGVHRVQRVPKTEKSGRIHTSTAAVAVLPAPREIHVQINPKELKIETKRASGAGGQHVNKTESAVRITHIPTGIAIECQTERSQIQNRQTALKKLRAKLLQIKVEKQDSKLRQARKLQVGDSSRSEKIRTYNFVQDRVTDHRVGLTMHNLTAFINGQSHFQSFVDSLLEFDKNERLNEIFSSR